MEYVMVSKIGIIGAGVSGLATAKYLSHYEPIVFEASGSIGGVWKHCCYGSTRLQSYRKDYEFSDFPWGQRDSQDYPSHVDVLNYLQSYALHFDILRLVKYHCKVLEIRYMGDSSTIDVCIDTTTEKPVWELAVYNSASNSIQWYAFQFVVVCMGKYGDIPIIPEFPHNKGPEVFQGRVLHTIEYCKMDEESRSELLKDKKVVIVGYKKSATDLAIECAEANQGPRGHPCTIIIRTLHWVVPHYWVWGLPFSLFYGTRLSQLLERRPDQSFLRTLCLLLLAPLRYARTKFTESYIQWKLPLTKYGLKPEHSLEEDYNSCQLPIVEEKFFNLADTGKIHLKKSKGKWWFNKDEIEFDDNTKIKADVVIFATGYAGDYKVKNILPEPFKSLLEKPLGVMPLFRGTIHPHIPNMAFIGYLQSLSNLHTSELRSIWLARLIDDKFKLPCVEEMIKQTTKQTDVMRKSSMFHKRFCLSSYSIHQSDEMCKDMGWNTWRKSTWLEEAFSPYRGEDYFHKR